MVIDLPFEGRKVEGSRKYSRRERVPKVRSRGEETITEPINSRIGELPDAEKGFISYMIRPRFKPFHQEVNYITIIDCCESVNKIFQKWCFA